LYCIADRGGLAIFGAIIASFYNSYNLYPNKKFGFLVIYCCLRTMDAFIFADIYNNQNYSSDQNLTPNDLRDQLHYCRQIIQLPLEMLDANDSRMIFINNLMSTYEEMTEEAENSSNYLYVVVILCVALGVVVFMLKSRVRVSFKLKP